MIQGGHFFKETYPGNGHFTLRIYPFPHSGPLDFWKFNFTNVDYNQSCLTLKYCEFAHIFYFFKIIFLLFNLFYPPSDSNLFLMSLFI